MAHPMHSLSCGRSRLRAGRNQVSYYKFDVYDSEDDDDPKESFFETDSESMMAASHLIGLLDGLDNGERIVVTADIF